MLGDFRVQLQVEVLVIRYWKRSDRKTLLKKMLQLKTKYLVKRENWYYLTQKNLVKFLVQVYLLYIPLVHRLCISTTLNVVRLYK